MRVILAALLAASAMGPALAQESGPPSPSPQAEDTRPVDDFRLRQREEELRRDPREDWRDQSWTSDSWRSKSLHQRAYERQGRSWRAARMFDAGPYRWPESVRPRTWTFGERLPPALHGPGAALPDPAAFGLAPAPHGRDWVRVASDALLVSRADGRIERIAYGLFR